METFRINCWEKVENHLKTLEGKIYYVGGTLCVDLSKFVGVGMNLNGKGFIYGSRNPLMKNSIVYLPDHISSLVKELYLKLKGETEHYKESIKCQMK